MGGGETISFKLNIRLCDSARHFFFFLAAAKETRSAGLRVALTAEAQTIETWNKDEGADGDSTGEALQQ